MGVFSNVFQEIGDVINGLSVSAKEKQQIQADIIALLYRHESELTRGRLEVVDREAQGNWLQRSWRPIVMLVFTLVILLGVFNPSPLLSETSRFGRIRDRKEWGEDYREFIQEKNKMI